jgi:hypothetical protein
MRAKSSSLWWGAVLLSVSCATIPASKATRPTGTPGESKAVVEKVLATARSLLGNRPDARVKVNGRVFMLDCIGTIEASWWGADIDISQDFARYRGNGVNRLYESLQSWGALHWQKTPSPGDLIIWDRTWDTGDDPNYPNGHTHAGIVLAVSSEGTVEYLHESVTRGVVIAYLNLYDPSKTLTPAGKVVNSPMYLGSNYGRKDNPPLWTSGQLWSAFGDAAAVSRTLGG